MPNAPVRVTASHEKLRRITELRAEKRRLAGIVSRNVDVYAALHFTPNPGPQTTFLGLPDVDEDVLYGGAAGGSKSTSLLIHAIRSCVRYPGLQAFWFRRTFPELEQSVLRMLARFHYAKALGARYDKSQHELRFDNGSILRFTHAKNKQDAESLLSAEINALYLDERTTLPPEVVDLLYTRVRSGVEGVPCLGVRSATNPGGVGHLRVLNGFVKATDHGKAAVVDEGGRTVRFIQARATDTPQLDPATYQKRLAAVPDPELRAAMRDGSWDIFPNQVFGEFRHARHVVPHGAVELPSSLLRYGAVDYGWSAPSVYLLGARDGDGRVWVYRELTMTKTPEPEQARRILAAEDVLPCMRAADPAMWGKTGSALPPASQYAMEGAALRKADNDRIGGWGRVHTFLADAPACRYHAELGWATCPAVHIVDRPDDVTADPVGCPRLIETLPALPRDKNRPEDVDTDSDDHWADTLRYLLMSIGSTPRLVLDDEEEADREPIVAPEDQHEQRGVVAYGQRSNLASIAGTADVDVLDPSVMGGARSPWAT